LQTVTFEAGKTILAEGEFGDTAFLIVSGSVDVSVGSGPKQKHLATLRAGDVFGEMSLIEPGPRSATVRAVTDVSCHVADYDGFLEPAQADLGTVVQLMKTLVRRLRHMNERLATLDPEMGPLIQQWLKVILAGLDEQESLSASEMEILQRELRILLHVDRLDVASAETEKAEQVLSYMLRPSMEECLALWFGKSEETDREIWERFGTDVGLASRGHYDHWALNVEHPRLLVALVIMLDQFRRNLYRDTPEMYSSDARALALVKRGLRVGVAKDLRPIERVFLCLVLTHSEALEDQHLCMEEWERAMEELAPDDPLNVFHEVFHRHVAVIMRFGRFPHRNTVLGRASTPAEEEFLADNLFRFDLPLVRQPGGALSFVGTTRTVRLFDHEYQSFLPDAARAANYAFEYAGPDAVFSRTQAQLKKQGYVRIGDTVPNFTASTSLGPIDFHEFIGAGWCVFFSHPADFTPVCTTELAAAARLHQEWKKRGTKLVALSVDSLEDHARWIEDINETQQVRIGFPIIADTDRHVSMLFGMLDSTTFGHGPKLGETLTVRSVFIISPSKRVELNLTYPAQVGRNFDEILRALDALQLSAEHKVATPADWRPGQEALALPSLTDDQVERMFAEKGEVRRVKSYLRFVRDPSLRVI
jgi:alkyl hydroperoxide reductase subunit AhpC/uncharacterized protein (DUF924 family)/CRP-like cAMP-binding protein